MSTSLRSVDLFSPMMGMWSVAMLALWEKATEAFCHEEWSGGPKSEMSWELLLHSSRAFDLALRYMMVSLIASCVK